MTRTFQLGDVLTITTGCLVSPRGVAAVYDVCNYMTGDNLFTHQLPRATGECKPAILAQHPDLADVRVPDGGWPDEAAVLEWLAVQVDRFGGSRDLTPLLAEDHTRINPFEELLLMGKAPEQIIAVEVDPEATP